MTGFLQNRSARPRSFTAATVVCLILLALLAVVQVAHVHPQSSDADNCPLCIVLHSAAPVAAAVAAIVLVPLSTPTPVFEAHTVARPWHPTQFTRPPPSV
jgi:amino acid transporter